MKDCNSRSIDNNRGFFWRVLFVCIAATTIAIEARSAEIPTATLALVGDTIPGGNGTFSSFEPRLGLNDDGKVAFIAFLSDTPDYPDDAVGIYLADTQAMSQLVRTGQSVPDGNGTFRDFISGVDATLEVALNDNGSVAFPAQLSGTSGGVNDNFGLFGVSADGVVKQYLRASDAAPGGNGVFPYEPPPSLPGIDNLGNTYFYSLLDGTSGGQKIDDRGVFQSDGGTLTALARAGDAVPGDTNTFVRILPWVASNLGGQVAFIADLYSEPFDAQLAQPQLLVEEPESFLRIYVSSGASLQEVVRGGMNIANAEGSLGNFSSNQANLRLADNGNIVFKGGINGLGISSLFYADGGSLFEMARQGDLGPGEDLFRFVHFTGVAINNDRAVFSATLERNAIPPDNDSSGIYLWSGGALTTLVHQGDAVPGGNGSFGKVAHPVFMNSSGEFVFSAALEGTDDPVKDTTGIYFVDSDGTIHEVARFGKSLAGSTIVFATYLGHVLDEYFFEGSTLGLAGMTAINDSGQVVFTAALADGRGGLFLWNASNEGPDLGFIFEDSFE